MRLGTWNLEGTWGDAQAERMATLECDVWLLTEVAASTQLDGFDLHTSGAEMAPQRRWAAVAARTPLGLRAIADPHPASAAVEIGALTVCSSVLPWRSSGGEYPWSGASNAERTANALGELVPALPVGRTVWGGDWNHALTGKEHAGSMAGRDAIVSVLGQLAADAITVDCSHRIPDLFTIDHIAVPSGWAVTAPARRVEMTQSGRHLSDHDAYVVDVEPVV